MHQPQAHKPRGPEAPPKGYYARMAACDGNEHTADIVEALAVFHLLMSSLNVG